MSHPYTPRNDNQVAFDAGMQSQIDMGMESAKRHHDALLEQNRYWQAVTHAMISGDLSGLTQAQTNQYLSDRARALANALRNPRKG